MITCESILFSLLDLYLYYAIVSDSKLSDIGNGGPGTVFNLFEYTTEGTPHGSPRISSGYAIVRDTGEMIYRTSSNPTDLNGRLIGLTLIASKCHFTTFSVRD